VSKTVRTVDGSSTIVSVGYDSDASELRVLFASGGVFSYEGVTQEAYAELMRAPSKGQHFHKHIKHNYPAKKVEEQFV
jgi:hypothetical protein